jgi:DNA repair exonuclease SbcCD ATPase subunit
MLSKAISKELTGYKRIAEKTRLNRLSLIQRLKADKSALKDGTAFLDRVIEAQSVLQTIAQTVQQKAHEQIATIVTRCLQVVFPDDPYEFKILFEKKRSKTEARLVFCRNGEEFDPIEETGGGCVDVASFALRLACMLLQTPQSRRLMVLDEPVKHLDENAIERFRDLIETLAKEMKVQFIIITHFEQLQAGKVVRLTKRS